MIFQNGHYYVWGIVQTFHFALSVTVLRLKDLPQKRMINKMLSLNYCYLKVTYPLRRTLTQHVFGYRLEKGRSPATQTEMGGGNIGRDSSMCVSSSMQGRGSIRKVGVGGGGGTGLQHLQFAVLDEGLTIIRKVAIQQMVQYLGSTCCQCHFAIYRG